MTAASLPNTWHATIVIASDCVGFTLPGMIDEPGSFSGRISSPSPLRGPDPSNRMSFAIFINEAASVASPPEANTIASWAASAANLFGAETNGNPVSSAIFAADASAKPAGAFNPVPTAVPPIASSYRPGSVSSIRRMSASSCATYPPNSWPSVSGTASCRCVRPIFTMSANSSARAANAFLSCITLGSRRRTIISAAATCIAVGNVSLEDCDMFT